MELAVTFLGTGGSVPTARRSTASVLVQRGGDRMLVDCGEGTQRQMQRSVGLIEVQEVYLTHLHADHYLGLPGLLKTWDLHDRRTPLRVYGPRGLEELFAALRRIMGRSRFPVELVEIDGGEGVQRDGYAMRPFEVTHRVPALGYALVEEARPGRFDPQRARALGVEPGPAFGRLQDGETVAGTQGPVAPEQVLGPARPGRKVVVTGDTEPCEATRVASHEAQLLVHDASFADDERDRAAQTGHSTARQAAELAAEAEVQLLALVHVSSRYHIGRIVDEARSVLEAVVAPRDFDVVEIPLPERGGPRLIKDGARAEPGS